MTETLPSPSAPAAKASTVPQTQPEPTANEMPKRNPSPLSDPDPMQWPVHALCLDPHNPYNAIVYRPPPNASSSSSSTRSKASSKTARLPPPPPPFFTIAGKLQRVSVPLSSLPAGDRSLLRGVGGGAGGVGSEFRQRRVLVIANPKAGKQSRRVCDNAIRTIRHMLRDAGISIDTNLIVKETRGPRDATRLVVDALRDSNVRFDVVLAVGGDGTLFETVDGLVKCANATPVVPVPTGTGNAVAVSLALVSVMHAVLNVVKGLRCPAEHARPACLLRYRCTTEGQQTGIKSKKKEHQEGSGQLMKRMSTSTSRSRRMSSVGRRRRKSVAGRVGADNERDDDGNSNDKKDSNDNEESSSNTASNIDNNNKREERNVICGIQWGLPAQVDQGTEWMRALGDARFALGALGHILSKRDYRARLVIDVHTDLQAGLASGDSDPTSLSSLVEYADDWVCKRTRAQPPQYTLDGRFIMVVAWNCQAIAKDFVVTPLARIDQTEAFDVLIVPSKGLSRAQQLQVLLNANDGSFLRQAKKLNVKYFKATRLAVERVEGDFLTVDGESVPVQPFTLEVAPESGSVRVFDTMS